MIAYTDASVLKKKAYHSFLLYNNEGELIKTYICRTNISDTISAENHSIEILLKYCVSQCYNSILIFTDSKSSVQYIEDSSNLKQKYRNEIARIKKLIRETNSDINWISRRFNTASHKLCQNARKRKNTILKDTAEYTYTIKKQYNPQQQDLIYFTKETIPSKEFSDVYEFYCKLIIPEKRLSKNLFYEEANKLGIQSINSTRGRKHYVTSFILMHHHMEKDVREQAKEIYYVSHEIAVEKKNVFNLIKYIQHYFKFRIFKTHYSFSNIPIN